MASSLYWVLALAWGSVVSANYPPAQAQPLRYGHPKKSGKFMPAKPGETPSCVKDPRLTFCTDPDDYPKDRIRYLLENDMFDLSSVLQDETRDTYTFEAMTPPVPHYGIQHGYLPPPATSSYSNVSIPSKASVGSMRYRRQATAGPDDGDLCPSRAAFIRPRAAQSMSGDWMFLVNLDDNPQYTQLVRSETCLRNECTGACQAPPGATAVCQQQFVQKRLVALDGTGDQLSQDMFWFPSCCVCKIRR